MIRTERKDYVADFPNIQGLSEIHIFLEPLNPDNETIERYEKAVEEYNKVMLTPEDKFQMKACVLCLNYRKLGDVTVMQSSRYFYSADPQQVINETYKDGEWFSNKGFVLLRHKIECITTAKGVPQAEDWHTNPKRYFEFHIRVCKPDNSEDSDINDAEVDLLKEISRKFTDQFKTPIPLSYNKSAVRHQRYLNARFANCGAEEARTKINMIKDAISSHDSLKLVKTISEYVWYDDNRGVDHGWIDFTTEEQKEILGF